MLQWYESQRALVHDQIVLNITNDKFAPDILTADPCIREWANRVMDDARERALVGIDQKARQAAEDEFTTALTQYRLTHNNDLKRVRDVYQRELSRHLAEWQDNLKKAEEEYQTKIDEVRSRSHPLIIDPTARKKRRGSISLLSSPIVTKAQPLQMPQEQSQAISATPIPNIAPMPQTQVTPSTHPIAANPDPLAHFMDLMNKQFERISNRLDKIETDNKNTYTNWETVSRDEYTTRGADPTKGNQAPTEDPYANFNYDDPGFYDDPPNDPSYMGVADDAAIEANYPVTQSNPIHSHTPGDKPPNPSLDSDCMLLSGPPTPTATKTAPSGLRPPERAQRVDFESAKLATDSFGIPVGGRCNADGTISFSNVNPTRNNKPRNFTAPSNTHNAIYSNEELHRISKDAIISHAMFAFQHKIPRKFNKAQAIHEYQVAATNTRKPGAKQTTPSFATTTASNTRPQTIPRQTVATHCLLQRQRPH